MYAHNNRINLATGAGLGGEDPSPILRSLGNISDLSIPGLRALSPLSDKAQIMVDQAVMEVSLERLTGVADLLSYGGLVYKLSDPLSTPVLEWEQVNKVGTAQRTMSPSARGENNLVARKVLRLPIYLTTDDFSMGIRMLKASQRSGQPLDMTMVKQAVRRVNESLEDAYINGATTLDGQTLQVPVGTDDNGNAITGTVPGLLTPPGNVNNVTNSVDWTAANVIGTTGPAMHADVLAAVAKLNAARKFGPFYLYIGTNAGTVVQGQFSLYTPGTIQGMLESMSFGGKNLVVRVADRMPNAATGKQFVLVQMTDDTVQLVQGQPPTVFPWTSLDTFTLYWLVMAIAVPRVRADYDGNCGICTGTK